MKKKIVVIVGPTSSGKSALAVTIALTFNGEVVSADSRQVYRGLNIGTGKIKVREMRGIPHHLLDEVGTHQVFTAHDFLAKARGVIGDIVQRGKLPIVAGGTGFYIDALVGRVTLPEVSPNPRLRRLLEKKTAEQLFMLLRKKDVLRARTIDRRIKHRLIRALEIAAALGSVPRIKSKAPYDVLWIGISPARGDQEKKIHTRLLARMKHGMVAEARRLHTRGLSYKRMEKLGLEYRALARHLQGKATRKEMILGLERDIRRYAKRQITYWKRNSKIRWFGPKDVREIIKIVKEFLGGR